MHLKYPISDPPTEEEIGALPLSILKTWYISVMGKCWIAYPTHGHIIAMCRFSGWRNCFEWKYRTMLLDEIFKFDE